MYLKKMEIVGFKSFANKTTINFSEGITSIVGPNGCGKTNILDAMRWVLGEQKVSHLRGSKMEEVIFNGSRDMKPLGMAEVSLMVKNDRGVLPTEYSEVQITRRLFRSGESEYLLNKIQCRLKDIHELFYDTGMGAHSYSVIQQDMIDSVISDRAEERRFLFEEAAGITKYKQRKKAALRKLEATENDFLRLNDIFSEVQTQVRSLKRQYKKAERYQMISDEIKSWELYLGSSRIKDIEAERRRSRAEIDRINDMVVSKNTELDQASAKLEKDRDEQIGLERELSQVSQQVFEITESAHSLENEISVLREKRSNARTLIDRNTDEIKALEARSEILSQQIGGLETDVKRRHDELAALTEQLKEAETVQAEADRKLMAARTDREKEGEKLVELEGKLSSGRTEDDNLKAQDEEYRTQLTELSTEIEKNKLAREELGRQLQNARAALESVTAKKESTRRELAETNEKINAEVHKAEKLSEEIAELNASLEACAARKTLLEDMMLQYEGYESGVQSVMEVKERWPEISGTVADLFVPTEGLEIAMEASLGELARYIVCKERKTAEAIIDFLKSENKGRIGLLVPDAGMLNPVVKRPEMPESGFVGWLDSFVSTEEQLRPLMEAVLSRVAIFDKGTDPQTILERLPYGFKAVSTDGMVYSKNVISGGSEDKFPLFRRKEKVAEQEEATAQLNADLEQKRNEKNRSVAELAELRARSSQLNDQLSDIDEEHSQAQSTLKEINVRLETLGNESSRLEREHRSTSERLDKIHGRQGSLQLDFSQLSSQKENLMELMSAAGAAVGDLEQAATKAQEDVSRLHVKVVETRSQIEQIESRITHTSELIEELSRTKRTKEEEIVNAEKEIEHSSARAAELEIELKSAFERRTSVAERQNELRTVQGEVHEVLSTQEKALKSLRTEKDSLSDQLHKIELTLNTLESEASSIQGRIEDEYEVDVRNIEPVNPDPEADLSHAREMLQEKKERLKNFGAVNLLALEEYHTAVEREKFLSEQIKDLDIARKDLTETIDKINETARQLFRDTFSKVQRNFEKLFVDLFTGGEARIRLIDPDDPLESDIDIIARPRGKKLLSITMMSGGERALTAIALLFALYMVKPSPFCILDEIDAPLDDANCRRFLQIIGTFSKQTQFIVITHNKITMAAAHNLYGVTMEQPGISKLVAVKFDASKEDETESTVVNANSDEEPDESVDVPPEVPPLESDNGSSIDDIELPEAVVNRITPRIKAEVDQDE